MRAFHLLSLLSLLACSVQRAELEPDWIADAADLLTEQEEVDLRQMLIDFEDRTSVRVVGVSVPSLDGRSIASFTADFVASWGLASDPLNNYVAFCVAMSERQRHVDVGIGMRWTIEESLIDSLMEATAADFAHGRYFEGFLSTIGPIMAANEGVDWQISYYDMREVMEASDLGRGRIVTFEATIVGLGENVVRVATGGNLASILIGRSASLSPLSVEDMRIFYARIKEVSPPVLWLLGLEEI